LIWEPPIHDNECDLARKAAGSILCRVPLAGQGNRPVRGYRVYRNQSGARGWNAQRINGAVQPVVGKRGRRRRRNRDAVAGNARERGACDFQKRPCGPPLFRHAVAGGDPNIGAHSDARERVRVQARLRRNGCNESARRRVNGVAPYWIGRRRRAG